MEYKWDGYNLSMEDIQELVDLGENPSEAELNAVGLSGDGQNISIIDMKLFEKARRERTLRFDRSNLNQLLKRIEHRRGTDGEER